MSQRMKYVKLRRAEAVFVGGVLIGAIIASLAATVVALKILARALQGR